MSVTKQRLEAMVALAGRAPSLHNSQPWRFRLHPDGIDLRIDPSRALGVTDPRARELVLSCGAALLTLRLAARAQTLTAQVTLLPDPDDALLLARVDLSRGEAPTEGEQRLLRAVVRRYTNRLGFTDEPMSDQLMAQLVRDVHGEGAALTWVTASHVSELTDLVRNAEDLRQGSPSWQTEMAEWVSLSPTRRDGVPRLAVPPPDDPRDRLPAPRFAPASHVSAAPRSGPPGRVAVLTTADDRVTDWVNAGQALQRMLLSAADNWVFATYNTAPLEVPALREQVRAVLGIRDHPQMLLELGHSVSSRAAPRLSPRDLVDDRAAP